MTVDSWVRSPVEYEMLAYSWTIPPTKAPFHVRVYTSRSFEIRQRLRSYNQSRKKREHGNGFASATVRGSPYDVSENSGTPKSSILTGFSIRNHPFWGTPIFGNTHIASSQLLTEHLEGSGQLAMVQNSGT